MSESISHLIILLISWAKSMLFLSTFIVNFRVRHQFSCSQHRSLHKSASIGFEKLTPCYLLSHELRIVFLHARSRNPLRQRRSWNSLQFIGSLAHFFQSAFFFHPLRSPMSVNIFDLFTIHSTHTIHRRPVWFWGLVVVALSVFLWCFRASSNLLDFLCRGRAEYHSSSNTTVYHSIT